jgi:hypothetical protein
MNYKIDIIPDNDCTMSDCESDCEDVIEDSQKTLNNFYQKYPEFDFISATLKADPHPYYWSYSLETKFMLAMVNGYSTVVTATWYEGGCSCNSFNGFESDDDNKEKITYTPSIIKQKGNWYLLENNQTPLSNAIQYDLKDDAIELLQKELVDTKNQLNYYKKNSEDLYKTLEIERKKYNEMRDSCNIL